MGSQQVLNMDFNHLAASQFPPCFSHGRQIQPQPLQDGALRDRFRNGRRKSWGWCQPWAEGLGLTWEIHCLGSPQSNPDPPLPLTLSLTCEALWRPDWGGGVGREVIARVVGGINLQGQKGDGQQCHPELAVPSQWHPPPAGTSLPKPTASTKTEPSSPINPGVSLCPYCHHPECSLCSSGPPVRRKQELSGIVAGCTVTCNLGCHRPVPSSLNQHTQGKHYWDLQDLLQGLCRVVLAEQHQAGRAQSRKWGCRATTTCSASVSPSTKRCQD